MVFAITLTGVASSVRADILVRFPKGFDVGQMSEMAKGIERALAVHTIGVVESEPFVPDAPTAVPKQSEDRLAKARTAYKELDLPSVLNNLAGAEESCLQESSFGVCRGFLFEVGLLRGTALDAMGDKKAAARAFRSAHRADPTRMVDPRQYPPDILSAFAKACAVEPPPVVRIALVSEPDGARFRLDDDLISDPSAVALHPGTHLLEAELIGFERSRRIVTVDPASPPAGELQFQLTPESHFNAWKALVAHISKPVWHPEAPGVAALMERFRIDAVIRVSRKPGGPPILQGDIAVAGKPGTRSLSSPGEIGAPLPEGFLIDIKDALGIVEAPVVEAPVVEAPSPPSPDEEDQAEAEEEEEDPSIRFNGADEPRDEEETRKGIKLLKSPWFWVSVGAIVAIVTGVVVTTQVGD